jgi:hypothetical protein
MINAKQEFLMHTKGKEVKCATITIGKWDDDERTINLPCGYSKSTYTKFKARLNFEYDNGYGGQEIHGTIWYTDGSWSERGEYDGSEWWEFKESPAIPDYIKGE